MAGRWTVIAQRQFEELTPQGSFRSVVEVTFQLASGTTGSIKVPVPLYNEDYVREQIDAQAGVMLGVENLSG